MDGDGGRVSVRVQGQGSGVKEEKIYIGSLFEIQRTEDGGQTTEKIKKHIFAGSQKVCTIEPEHTYYTHSDHLGSSSVITDENGDEVSRLDYQPYGSVARQTGSDVVTRKFTGKELDSTGLYYFGARYYDPEIGRFIQADPTIQHPYDPQDLNRYAYCRNNPINLVDPTGYGWFKKFWKQIVGAFVGALVTALTLGAGAPLMVACFWGGLTGGALTGGLEGGVKGALIGGAIGGALGAVGGWGVGKFGVGFGVGMLLGGAGAAYGMGGSEGIQGFGAGVLGGLAGSFVGHSITSSGQFQNWKSQEGAFKQNAQTIKAKRALNIDKKNTTVKVVYRPLGDAQGNPGSRLGPKHMAIVSDQLKNGKWEMGPKEGIIQTTNTVGDLELWGTHVTTEKAISAGGGYAPTYDIKVNISALRETIILYEETFVGMQYDPINHNSNYAVNSVIYGAGGDTPTVIRAPGFPSKSK
ncbi:MAG: hypothetical protein KKF54_02790 [Candidatus Omnitrophica bacterium]|nr:hypothetical protein [Candidatus Omnitrophota bacterium]